MFGPVLTSTGILAIQGWGSANDFASSPPVNGVGSWLIQGMIYMDVAEVLVYNRALSSAELQQVTSYAVVKYGIGNSPSLIPVTDGLTLQLESDLNVSLSGGATVSGWLDQSGYGNDLVASGNPQLQSNNTPTGEPAIHLYLVAAKLRIPFH